MVGPRMFLGVAWVLVALAGVGILLWITAFFAMLRHTARVVPQVPDADLPPVSMLKPIKGDEEALEANLRTFFEQDYPAPIEIVFASTEADDPGIGVARRLAREYPHIPTRFVRSDPDFGLNPKVANLAGALARAKYEIVLQSDANVRVRPDYLRRVVSELEADRGALLTSMVVGAGERSVAAAMENVQLAAFIAPAMCFALRFAGITCVVGKSMLLRKRDLAELGGLEAVRDILAEDFILGERYQRAGKKVLLSSTTAENVNVDGSLERFANRHARWLKMRATIHLGGFVADMAANPTSMLLLAAIFSGLEPLFVAMFVGVAVLKAAGDALMMARTRGAALPWRYAWVSPLKDLIIGAVWFYAIFSRSVEWRGVRLRLGAGSVLRPDDGALPVRVLRRVFGLRSAASRNGRSSATTRSGCSTALRCPAPGIRPRRAPGISLAITSDCTGGVARSSVPQSTSVGSAIAGRSATMSSRSMVTARTV